jgi:hypothetical protein
MKTKFLLIAALIFSNGLSAQNEGHVFDIRAYGGVSLLQVSSDVNTSLIDNIVHQRTVEGQPGAQAGLALTFGNRFYLQPGFQWSRLSTKIVNENNVVGTELIDETTLSVISVPLKVGLRFIDPRKENLINARLFGGIDGHHVMSVTHSAKSGSTDDIDADDYSNIIMNADFGLGLDVWFLYLETGYQLGLTPIHKSGDNAKSSAFYANAGIRITFGK